MLITSLVLKTAATFSETKIATYTSTMTINHLKTVFEPTLETLRTSISYITPHALNNVQHNSRVMNRPLTWTVKELSPVSLLPEEENFKHVKQKGQHEKFLIFFL